MSKTKSIDHRHPSPAKYDDKSMCPFCRKVKLTDLVRDDVNCIFICPGCGQTVDC